MKESFKTINTNRLISVLFLLTYLLIVSCSSGTNVNKKDSPQKSIVKKTKDYNLIGKELIGKWKVDSVVVENETKERFTVKNQIFYEFKSNATLELSEQIKYGVIGNLIGDCRLDSNNDLIILNKEEEIIRYRFIRKDSILILNGSLMSLKGAVFGVKNYNLIDKEKKTMIFMSSYEDPYDEEIYGPRKNNH
jgi:hypothetical protein